MKKFRTYERNLKAASVLLLSMFIHIATFAQPANDCEINATVLTVGTAGSCSFTTGTTVAATQSIIFPVPTCGDFSSTAHGDVWYKFVVPTSGNAAIELDPGSQTTAGIALYEGSPPNPFVCIPGPMGYRECDDGDSPDGDGMPYILASGLPAGSTVYVRVWEPGNNALGTFNICVSDPVVPGGTPSCSLPDSCAIACDLGTLIPAAYCDGDANQGTTTASTFSLTNVGATASSPYIYMGGCFGNANMSSPAADVWYKFTATAPQLKVEISGGLSIPTVGLWDGACGNLIGRGCAVDSSGTLIATFTGLSSMEEYYLQISGEDASDVAAFSLTLSNTKNCTECLQDISMSVNPAPVGGVYPPSTTVTFTVTVNDWNRVQQNDMHGLLVNHAIGWDTSTLSVTPASACDGAGNWAWYNSVTGDSSGMTYGPGFFYDSNSGGAVNGNPGDNFGDLCPGMGHVFSWSVTTDTFSCVGAGDLLVEVSTTGDGQSGSWDTISCSSDQTLSFTAAVNCLLPIELIFINAEKDQGSNLVTWAVATELTNDYYIVERSLDGQHFTEIGEVDGMGTTSERQDYQFLDDFVHPGTVWYRVHQIDINGMGSHTESVLIHPNGDEAYIHQIYPNPAETELFVHLVVPKEGTYNIQILDLTGRVVKNASNDLTVGTHEVPNDVSDLSAGQYIIRLRNMSTGSTMIQKFVK